MLLIGVYACIGLALRDPGLPRTFGSFALRCAVCAYGFALAARLSLRFVISLVMPPVRSLTTEGRPCRVRSLLLLGAELAAMSSEGAVTCDYGGLFSCYCLGLCGCRRRYCGTPSLPSGSDLASVFMGAARSWAAL